MYSSKYLQPHQASARIAHHNKGQIMATRHKTAKRLLIKRLAINIFQLKATATHCWEAWRKLFSEWGVPFPVNPLAHGSPLARDFTGGGHRLLAEVVGELANLIAPPLATVPSVLSVQRASVLTTIRGRKWLSKPLKMRLCLPPTQLPSPEPQIATLKVSLPLEVTLLFSRLVLLWRFLWNK